MTKELEEKIRKSWAGIEYGSYLDAHEEREKALEILRDKIFALTWWYNQCSNDDHPARQEINKEEMEQVAEELCCRFQDYETFMWDYKKDWELNYNDYNLG
jgi:hypothetical protein